MSLLLPPLRSWRTDPGEVCKIAAATPNDSNDGDSFHVSARGHRYIFRLYFVDAPETDASFPERVAEQAAYFKLSIPQTLELGELREEIRRGKTAAAVHRADLPAGGAGAEQPQRFYAFVETKEGDLAELLVANGLARVHGSEATPAGLRSPELEWHKLQRLENEARQEKVGGWGATFGRMTARSLKPRTKVGLDSFDAFFHPEKLAIDESG